MGHASNLAESSLSIHHWWDESSLGTRRLTFLPSGFYFSGGGGIGLDK